MYLFECSEADVIQTSKTGDQPNNDSSPYSEVFSGECIKHGSVQDRAGESDEMCVCSCQRKGERKRGNVCVRENDEMWVCQREKDSEKVDEMCL